MEPHWDNMDRHRACERPAREIDLPDLLEESVLASRCPRTYCSAACRHGVRAGAWQRPANGGDGPGRCGAEGPDTHAPGRQPYRAVSPTCGSMISRGLTLSSAARLLSPAAACVPAAMVMSAGLAG